MADSRAAVDSSTHRIWRVAAIAIVLSTALHIVPQLLRDVVNPAWSMLGLMIVDAAMVALLVRSRTALVIGVVLSMLLGATVLTHQQLLAALPSIALNLMMAGLFGATLRRHETPLIVRIAELDQGALPPDFARYLRALTQAWTIFFVAMAALSLILMLYAPFEWWSLFVNVLTWPLIGAMFAIEWVVRRIAFKALPAHTPLRIMAKVLAYQRHAAEARDRSHAG